MKSVRGKIFVAQPGSGEDGRLCLSIPTQGANYTYLLAFGAHPDLHDIARQTIGQEVDLTGEIISPNPSYEIEFDVYSIKVI